MLQKLIIKIEKLIIEKIFFFLWYGKNELCLNQNDLSRLFRFSTQTIGILLQSKIQGLYNDVSINQTFHFLL